MSRNPLQPPIFLEDSGDVLAFASIPVLERYVEPVDVSDGVYRGWDSTGRVMLLMADTEGRVVARGTGQVEPEVLLGILSDALLRSGSDLDGLGDEDLVALACQRFERK